MPNMAKCGFSGPQNSFLEKRTGRSYWLNLKELPITAENDHFRGLLAKWRFSGLRNLILAKKRVAPIGKDLKNANHG